MTKQEAFDQILEILKQFPGYEGQEIRQEIMGAIYQFYCRECMIETGDKWECYYWNDD